MPSHQRTLEAITADVFRLVEDISAFAASRPQVQGVSKLHSRAKRELAFAQQLAQQQQVRSWQQAQSRWPLLLAHTCVVARSI